MYFLTILLIIIPLIIKQLYKEQNNNFSKHEYSYSLIKKLILIYNENYDDLILNVISNKYILKLKFLRKYSILFNVFSIILRKIMFYYIKVSIYINKLDIYHEKHHFEFNINNNTKKTIKYLAKCSNMDIDQLYLYLEKSLPKYFSEYISFNVFGDYKSNDIDVIVVVNDVSKPLKISEYNRLYNELKYINYDMNKEIDLNIVTVKDFNIDICKKGGREIQNVIFYTYKNHKQLYPIIIKNVIDFDIHNKAMSINKFILNYLIDLVDDYKEIRHKKASAYSQGGINLINFTISLWPKFIKNSNNPKYNKNVWKSLIVKYIQLIVLYLGIYDNLSDIDKNLYYNKDGMYQLSIKIVENLGIDKNKYNVKSIYNLLFRKECINFDLIEIFHNKFAEIIIKTYPNFTLNKKTLFLNPKNIKTSLTSKLFELYQINPIKLTDNFCKLWIKTYGQDKSIQDKFISECINIDSLKSFPEIMNKIHFEPQCSNKWKELLKFYSCGNNTGLKELSESLEDYEVIQKRSNLIMGLLGEEIIFNCINFNNLISNYYILTTIGLLVKEKGKKNSIGCAPDGLLISLNNDNKNIIPIEIKTIASKPSDNSIFRREFILGKKQLKNAIDILNFNNDIISNSGLLIILWIYKKNNNWIYETNYELINF